MLSTTLGLDPPAVGECENVAAPAPLRRPKFSKPDPPDPKTEAEDQDVSAGVHEETGAPKPDPLDPKAEAEDQDVSAGVLA